MRTRARDEEGTRLPPELLVMLMGAVPLIERASILTGLVLGLPTWEAFFMSLLGQVASVPVILLGLLPLRRWLAMTRLRPLLLWLEGRTLDRGREVVERWGPFGIALFVSIPLPGTGPQTGALLAVLMGIPFRHAFPAVAAGATLASLALLALFRLGFHVLGD